MARVMSGIVARAMRRRIVGRVMSGMILVMPGMSAGVPGGIVILTPPGVMPMTARDVSIPVLPGKVVAVATAVLPVTARIVIARAAVVSLSPPLMIPHAAVVAIARAVSPILVPAAMQPVVLVIPATSIPETAFA